MLNETQDCIEVKYACLSLGVSALGSANNSTQSVQTRPGPLPRGGNAPDRDRSHSWGKMLLFQIQVDSLLWCAETSATVSAVTLTQEMNNISSATEYYKDVLKQDNTHVEAIACIGSNHFYTDQPEIALRFYRLDKHLTAILFNFLFQHNLTTSTLLCQASPPDGCV